MQMLESRNKTSHAYNQKVADEIASDVLFVFIPFFIELEEKLNLLTE